MGVLNRRHLRTKVLQALYAFNQTENITIDKAEKDLFKSIDNVHELYVNMLLLLVELKQIAINKQEENAQKLMPTADDLNPNMRFVENKVLEQLSINKDLLAYTKVYRTNWQAEDAMMRRIFTLVSQSEAYQDYLQSAPSSLKEAHKQDRSFIAEIFKEYIANSKPLQELLEEQSIFWMDDLDMVCIAVIKTIQNLKVEDGALYSLMNLYNDEEDDKAFVTKLFRASIKRQDEHYELIDAKTKNWELERVALVDKLIMNLALTEAREFSNIPLKVTLNEFIDISKYFSTPKSNGFINGVLDKLFEELKNSQQIVKTGLGLK